MLYGEPTPEFIDPFVRRSFIKRTFFILLCQHCIIFVYLLIAVYLHEDEVNTFFWDHMYLSYIAMGLSLTLIVVMSCFVKVSRTKPYNYILLLLFTLSYVHLIVGCGMGYGQDDFLLAVGLCLAIITTITIGATISKIDVTHLWFFIFLIVVLLGGIGIIVIFPEYRTVDLLVIGAILLLYTCVLYFQMILMLGGSYRVKLTGKDHVLASMCLYLGLFEVLAILVFHYLVSRHTRPNRNYRDNNDGNIDRRNDPY